MGKHRSLMLETHHALPFHIGLILDIWLLWIINNGIWQYLIVVLSIALIVLGLLFLSLGLIHWEDLVLL